MRFVLHYRGPLRSNADAHNKHQLRLAFHHQLATLWGQTPLRDTAEAWLGVRTTKNKDGAYLIRMVKGRTFVPVVSAQLHTIAELRIVMLRPGRPGQLLQHGGDIDNRLKTLFDALTIPQENQLKELAPSEQNPVYCLLEDDWLVSAVEVRTEQLLETVDPSWVEMTLDVRTRVTRETWGNTLFA